MTPVRIAMWKRLLSGSSAGPAANTAAVHIRDRLKQEFKAAMLKDGAGSARVSVIRGLLAEITRFEKSPNGTCSLLFNLLLLLWLMASQD